MNALRRKSRVGVGVGSVIALVALILATSGMASAQSRAASRWNHDATQAARVPLSTQGVRKEADRKAKVIRLNDVYSDAFTFVDVGEPGDSPGDYGVFRDPVSKPGSGKVVGTIDVQCIAAYADQCRGSISLDGRGQITFDGITPLGVDPDQYAVTGGTGEFVGAEGVLHVSFPSDTFARLTVRLTD